MKLGNYGPDAVPVCRAPRGARGLKQHRALCANWPGLSRPARGAWIETLLAKPGIKERIGRAPRGARGLKPSFCYVCHRRSMSRPARGAWIETRLGGPGARALRVAPRAGRVD